MLDIVGYEYTCGSDDGYLVPLSSLCYQYYHGRGLIPHTGFGKKVNVYIKYMKKRIIVPDKIYDIIHDKHIFLVPYCINTDSIDVNHVVEKHNIIMVKVSDIKSANQFGTSNLERSSYFVFLDKSDFMKFKLMS